MRLVDARRLTGPNLLSRAPLVIVDLALDGADDRDAAVAAYLSELARMRAALDHTPEVTPIVRGHAGGVVVAYAEPIDVMLPWTEASEWAAVSAVERLAGRDALPIEPRRAEIAAMLEAARNPRLLALEAAAAARGVPFLWDDALASVGHGRRAQVWPLGEIPAVEAIPWSELGTVPIALVTGTNGKTTTSRLLARIGREAGRVVGATSTEGVTIGDARVEDGDWTGPAAARRVLRDASVELAILETARGGILRRGLAMDACDAAVITNVSDDHLGDYGIDDVAAMTHAKGVVARAVARDGRAVLNARQPHLVALARDLACEVVWFADLDADEAAAPLVAAHRARGGRAVLARGGQIVLADGARERALLDVTDAPITFRGAARHNVENLLAAVAAATSLRLDDAAIARAARSFDGADNPGRGELLSLGDVRILLDFAHNPDGVTAALAMVAGLRAGAPGRLVVITGSAGDRTDDEIAGIARAIAGAKPDRVIVRELPLHLRGRALGEVPALFARAFAALGLSRDAVSIVASEVEALRVALDDARAGDFVALLVHLDREGVRAHLAARVS